MAVLLITHDLGVVANVAEEIIVMYRGEIMESGALDDIFSRARHPYLRALLRAVPRFDMQPGERLTPLREIPPGDAPHLMAQRAPWPADATGPLLECTDIRKSFGLRRGGLFRAGSGLQVVAVDGVSLRIGRGECLGLVGESGCGKTTLSKVLLRALTPDSGSVMFSDKGVATDVLALDGEGLKRFRRRVQFIFQDLFGSLNLAVVDYIADRIAVMCGWRIVDIAPRGELFRNPVHPYTQALLAAIPVADPEHRLDFHRLMEGRASDPL